MTEYFVGIDGGGTSCRARVRDSKGDLIGEAKTGSANILLGVETAMSAIVEAITQAANQGGLTTNDCRHMHVGLALAGAEQRDTWQAFMNLPNPFKSLTLNTDAYGACLGAHSGDDGAIMIAGTGSCGLLLLNGEQYVVGGREFPISDQGSGAIMGLHLIQQMLLIDDGILPHSQLAQEVRQEFGDIDNIVSWSKRALPRDYGKFCPRIFYYATEGDWLAIKLLKQTAQDIEIFLTALHKKGATRICLMGSIAERILPWLTPPAQQWIVPAKSDAVEGALMFAGRPEHNLY
ncbi:N-acetylglucosamine kinase [Vibrio sp. FNV 38]|nr:N-acetylglucosamine kinase [Vibrio sp. FNV 38]